MSEDQPNPPVGRVGEGPVGDEPESPVGRVGEGVVGDEPESLAGSVGDRPVGDVPDSPAGGVGEVIVADEPESLVGSVGEGVVGAEPDSLVGPVGDGPDGAVPSDDVPIGQVPTSGNPSGRAPSVDAEPADNPQSVTTRIGRAAAAGQRSSRIAKKVVYLVPAGVDFANSNTSESLAVRSEETQQAGRAGQPARADRAGRLSEGARPESGAATGSEAADGDGDVNGDIDEDAETEHRDWAWVEEWRAEQEPTPWASGLVLAAFSALVVGVAIWVLCAGLADRPVIAVLVNILVAAGLAPAMWLSRGLPVLRWIAAGASVGVVGGWIAAVLMLPLPLP